MDKELAKLTVGSLARHAGNLVAGGLLANGYIRDDMTQQVVGVVSGIVLLGWSLLQKRMTQRKGG